MSTTNRPLFSISLWLVLGVALFSGPRAAGSHPPAGAVAFIEVHGEPEALAAQLAGLPAIVRLADTSSILLEVAAGELPAVRAALPRAAVVAGPAAGIELWQLPADAIGGGELQAIGGTIVRRGASELIIAAPTRSAAGRAAERLGTAGGRPLPPSFDLRALRRHSAAELAHPYRRSRVHDPGARARARALSSQVSAATIEEIIRELSEYPNGEPRSRFAGKPLFRETYADSMLLPRLRAIFSGPNDVVTTHAFTALVDGAETELVNLIGFRPGTGSDSGKYLLGAHYDCIATNSEGGWNPSMPAPGADDNASGVACVLEAARVLLASEHGFGIEVVLFGSEERYWREGSYELPGLLGSTELVADRPDEYGPDQLLGAFVCDMVGYNPRAAEEVDVVTNNRSEWMGDLLVEAGENLLAPGDALQSVDKIVNPAFGRSDHASFWSLGSDAVLLIENMNVEPHNPNYDSNTDRADSLAAVDGFDQVRRVAELIVAALGQFANPTGDPEPRPLSADLAFDNLDGGFGHEGRVLGLRARLVNDGEALGAVSVRTRAVITPRRTPVAARAGSGVAPATAAAVTLDSTFAFDSWDAGARKDIVVFWVPGPDDGGVLDVRFEVEITDGSGKSWLPELAGEVRVLGDALRVLDPYVQPNPVRGSLDRGRLSFQLNEKADIDVQVFDALGQRIGRYRDLAIDVDRTLIPLDRIIRSDDLPSGVYLLRLEADGSRYPSGGHSTRDVTFAYVR